MVGLCNQQSRNYSANIATLGNVAVKAKANHQLIHSLSDLFAAEVLVGRWAGRVSVTWHGWDDEMKWKLFWGVFRLHQLHRTYEFQEAT